jgi:hypothetical protein
MLSNIENAYKKIEVGSDEKEGETATATVN